MSALTNLSRAGQFVLGANLRNSAYMNMSCRQGLTTLPRFLQVVFVGLRNCTAARESEPSVTNIGVPGCHWSTAYGLH
jgi:hypothetical protein